MADLWVEVHIDFTLGVVIRIWVKLCRSSVRQSTEVFLETVIMLRQWMKIPADITSWSSNLVRHVDCVRELTGKANDGPD